MTERYRLRTRWRWRKWSSGRGGVEDFESWERWGLVVGFGVQARRRREGRMRGGVR